MFYVKKYTAQPTIEEREWISDIEKYFVDQYAESGTTVPKYPLINIGFKGNKLIFELDLAGYNTFKVTYVGNVITVFAQIKQNEQGSEQSDKCCSCCTCHSGMDYVQRNIPCEDVERKFYLVNDYLGSDVKWNCKDGILRIVVTPADSSANTEIQPTEEIDMDSCECNCGKD